MKAASRTLRLALRQALRQAPCVQLFRQLHVEPSSQPPPAPPPQPMVYAATIAASERRCNIAPAGHAQQIEEGQGAGSSIVTGCFAGWVTILLS